MERQKKEVRLTYGLRALEAEEKRKGVAVIEKDSISFAIFAPGPCLEMPG